MRRTKRRPGDAGARRWRLIALACLGALALTVAVPQATAHDRKGLAHAVEHVLEQLGVLQGQAEEIGAKTDAIMGKTASLPSSPTSTSDTGTIVTDTFKEAPPAGTSLKSWVRDVEGTSGKQFLANITAQCVFAQPLNNTDVNAARVHLRLGSPAGMAPAPTTFEQTSTDHVITVVTGPVVGFAAPQLLRTYTLQCSAGGTNSVAQGIAQAWLQVQDG